MAAPSLAVPGAAVAQASSSGLRGSSPPGSGFVNPSDTSPALSDRAQPGGEPPTASARSASTDPARSGAQSRRPARPASRRTRVPTAAAVRADLRGALADQRVAPVVQPPQSGIPDPVEPILPPRKKPKPEDDPYASLGIRVGNVMLYPSVGESVGYDSNPNRVDGASRKGSFVSQTEAELRVQSDWSVHELSGFLRGAYNEYPSVPAARRPEGAGLLKLRLDVNRDTTVDTDVHYALDTQRFGTPNLTGAGQSRPIVNTEGASVAVTERFNRLAVTLRGTVDRTDYTNATLTDGSLLDLGDRAYTAFGGALRVAYEVNPGLVPFVEGLTNVRSYDQRTDFSGYRRSSDGFGARVGTSFELSRLVTGEVSVGAVQRRYDDPRLRDLTSPIAEGALTWLVTPLTTVRLGGQVSIDETTVVGSNGVVTERASLEIRHALWRNLTITPGINIFQNDYRGGAGIVEKGFGASLKAEYKLTRWLAFKASYTYEQLHSNFAGNDYTANVILVGLRYQP